MASQTRWKRFEDLAAHIQRSLASGATIEQNVRVLGQRSKVLREIDISVRTRVGQYELFIAIDCKDYRRNIIVKDVEEFIGLIKDIGANKGAMVVARGFSEAAKNRARDAGVDLYRLVDAEAHEWQSYVTLPVLIEDSSISTFNLTLSGTGPIRIAPQDFRNMTLYRADGSPIDIVRNLLARRWNEEQISHEPGEYRGVMLADEDTYILTDGIPYRIDVRANVNVVKTLYFGQHPLVEVKGFSDELRGGIITNSITTANIDFATVHESWQKVDTVESLAVRPVLTMGVSSLYPLVEVDD